MQLKTADKKPIETSYYIVLVALVVAAYHQASLVQLSKFSSLSFACTPDPAELNEIWGA